jgi:hypothetical protein
MSSYSYDTELERIKDPGLRADLDTLIRHDPRIPTGPLGAWALSYARWRRGDRNTYPTPPSGEKAVTIDGILRVDALVRELVEWRPRRREPDEVLVDDLTRSRVADWNPEA